LLYYLHLLNSRGERFMEKYDPENLELSTRDRVSRAMYREVKEGRGGPHGGVFGDMTFQEPGFIARMQPALYETYRKIGIDPEKEHVELAPTCHFFMGGAKVDEDWHSSVQGLFIIGENAAGIHGANRLSQNALAELLVSGTRAGKAAASFAKESDRASVDPLEVESVVVPISRMLDRETGIRPHALRARLKELMWEKVGLYRTDSLLQDARKELEEIRADLNKQCVSLRTRHYNQELAAVLENAFLVTAAECVIEGALRRTESRGAHHRDDHPKTDNENWLKHLVIRRGNDKTLDIETEPVDLLEIRPKEVGN